MYEAHYGLNGKPFQLNPDPEFYFSSKQHSRARAYLEYGVAKHEGFIVITGEIGAGKTTVLRGLIEGLIGSNVVVGHVVTTQLDAEDTLRMVGAAFGISVADVPKSGVLMALEAFLVNQAAQGRRVLLIVDEAQNLTAKAVEELRMLSNFQFGNQSLLQSFLVGQPEFRQILQRPEMEQFRQRVTATCHIGAMEEADTKAYILHRLDRAGSKGKPTFDDEALAEVHRFSGGIPRRINGLCDRLLLLGYLNGRTHLTAADVAEVAAELGRETHNPTNGTERAAELTEMLNSGLNGLVNGGISTGDLSAQLAELSSEQGFEQMRRLELSLLRLERTSAQTLVTLQRLVEAVTRHPGNPSP